MVSTSSAIGGLAAAVGAEVLGDPTVTVRDVTHDSRQSGPGTLFVAIPGRTHDGHDYVLAAADAGSPAVMVERRSGVQIPQLVVGDARAAMAPVAAEVHGHPSHRLGVVGVTGTNGKTTVTHLVEAMAATAGRRVGLIGTVHTRVGRVSIPNTRTTPESSDLQRLLANMADMGADVVAAEVSSHALEMHRVDATRFAVGAFTNLSQDHLDFHGDMERYYRSKARLFEEGRSDHAVVFMDDPAGRRLLSEIEIPTTRIGREGDVYSRHEVEGIASSRFVLGAAGEESEIRLPLGGRFNIDNALVAAGCALAIGIPSEAIVSALSSFEGVPGRFEVVSGGDPIRVVVDYAHTPTGIEAAIAAARAALSGDGRVIVVFGAGGDRDRVKRPQMGEAAMAADVVIATSDNPRGEDPEVILDAVLSQLPATEGVHRQTDRRLAIGHAIDTARDGDVVLILGRGHERGQEMGGRTLPFDDRQVAREALRARRNESR